MQSLTGCEHAVVRFVPNGTSPAFHFSNAPQEQRVEKVLSVTARAGEKHGDLVAAACKDLGVRFEEVTGMPAEWMPGAYWGAKVFVNASDGELMSRSIGEALVAGCRVLATKYNWGNTWYGGIAQIDPADSADLRRKIEWAMTARSWNYVPNQLAKRLTWGYAAGQLKKVYEEVL